MPGRKGGAGLRQGIDNEVYTVAVRLLEDETLQATVPALYQAIQKSNSSLKRKPKRVLEDSLERVLSVLVEDQSDEEAAIEAKVPEVPNIMNKSLTSAWKASTKGVDGVDTTAQSSRAQSSEPQRKRKREDRESKRKTAITTTSVRLEDMGGVGDLVKRFKNLIALPLLKPSLFARLSLPLPRGILLHGPPGCGKSRLTRAYAADVGVPVVEILGPSIVSGMSGESEKQVRDAFEEAKQAAPCILFIDEIDVIAPKRESSQSQMEKRIVAQLLLSMDSLEMETEDSKPVIVIAATNRPDSLDPALRRGGRFDTEINMGVPNEMARGRILKALTRTTPLAPDVDFGRLARMTAGFVGADLRDLVGKAGAHAAELYTAALELQGASAENGTADATAMDIDRPATRPTDSDLLEAEEIASHRRLVSRLKDEAMPEPAGFEHISVSMSSFLSVLPSITPSSKREGFATIPDTTWENIGALTNVREELQQSIVQPIRNPELYTTLGLQTPTGVLLWGPPGCGKTLLAKAVANESKANFISVKGPELLNKFVGESERALRTLFNRARSSVPCVIFFDELDALVPKRDDSSNESSARVVNTLLTELDGLGARDGIYVIAATNRPDIIDEAMLRPGRLETMLFVDLPGPSERAEILEAVVRPKRKGGGKGFAQGVAQGLAQGVAQGNAWPLAEQLAGLAESQACDGFSGADLESLVRRAGMLAVKRMSPVVEMSDFEAAAQHVKPSVGSMERYRRLGQKLGRA